MVAVTFASGTLVVAAAGNSREDGSPLEYPASLPHVLTAGAIDQSGQPTFFTSGSQYVDLAAPGWDIQVAVPVAYRPAETDYDSFSGTSFASPIVAGATAWVWTARPTLDITQLFEVMRLSAPGHLQPRVRPLLRLRTARHPDGADRSAAQPSTHRSRTRT